MLNDIKQRYGKLLAVLLLLCGLFLLWAIIIAPYQAMLSDQTRDVERAQQKLHSLESLIKNKDKFAAQYRSMQNNRSLDQVFLTRGKGVIAEARLQGIIRRLIEKNGSVLTQSSVKVTNGIKNNTQKTDAKDDRGITLQVAMRGSVESAYKIFHAIENGWPVMVVKNVTLQALSNQNGYKQYGRTNNQHAMTASYEVTAYVK